MVIFLVVKELLTSILGFFVMRYAKRRLNGAKWYGKVCTAVLYVIMLALVAFPGMEKGLQEILLIVCACGLALAFVMYTRLYIIMLIDSKTGRNDKVLY